MKKLLIACLLLACKFCSAQELKYTVANNDWDADSLGNQRVVLSVNDKANKIVITANIDWRRNDPHPEDKALFVVDASTNQRIKNVKVISVTRENCAFIFEPTASSRYYVYYLPYKVDRKSNYPNAKYLKSEQTASPEWLKAVMLTSFFTFAHVDSIQAINAMNNLYPMEVIAKASEVKALEDKYPAKKYLVFPEDRLHPIKMKHDLPQRWILSGVKSVFNADAARGENFAFQLGVYPVSQDLKDVKVTFINLKSKSGKSISSHVMSCINTTGIDYKGASFVKQVDVAKGDIQAMWCLVNVPKATVAGVYEGMATVTAKGVAGSPVKIILKVGQNILKNGGIDEPQKQTRLAWLNSTMAQQNEVIKPYIPLVVKQQSIAMLGRKVILDNTGFPKNIETFFTPEMTGMTDQPKEILNQPISFMLEKTDGTKVMWKPNGLKFTAQTPGTVKWEAQNTIPGLQMDVTGSVEFDGFVAYTVKVTALQDMSFNDLRLHIPMNQKSAKYMMGLNLKGEKRPSTYEWKWDVAHKNQDGAWIGDVNAGLQYSLRDEHYVRPLNTNFYLQKPLLLPTSWGNDDKGGIRVSENDSTVWVNNYSGSRAMKKGDVLYYNFNLLITPFHPINTDFQWATRFYHKYDNLDTIKATGATVVNIHHGTPINPFINYPFIAHAAMKAYIDEAHQKGLKVKIYNTIRELSNSAYEIYPLRSLGHEIYSPGKGGGYSWLQEHLGDDYIAAWYVPEVKDAAIINSGMNRWHNYYVEGMNWLVQNVGIDGIYLDDVAFDRVTMKRVKRVLTLDGHPGIIDLHSANQYNKSDGFNNSANLYLEHFPYLNRLWFGEYFDYEKNSPDFFLTEVSGIPFGLMGEMLQGGGNPWRGMIYGMTNRMPWSDNADPRPIWKVWDDFGMKGSKMIGYWVENNPVKTNSPDVLTTIYKKDKSVLVSIASWAKDDTNIRLQIDWKALGIDPAKATITAPEVKNFQPKADFKDGQEIRVEKGKGWIIVIKER
ncbi:MAG TPA: glycoside hydrolase domain-containing protein [Mucilaginibacter sp.]|nr:glycoside hydrolase domain-containing protein [Mucilaginibacter sp.]